MKKNIRTIVIFSEIDWKFLRQRHHVIAEYFHDKGYKVIFVQRVFSRIPSASELIDLFCKKILAYLKNNKIKDESTEIILKKSLYLPSNNRIINIYNKIISKYYYKYICEDSICYFFTPTPQILLKYLKRNNSLVIFDIIHNWWGMPWNKAFNKNNANLLCVNSDLLITDSSPIANFVESKFSKKISIMLPGVSNEWLKYCNCKPDSNLSNNKKLSSIFFGNLRSNSDIELLNDIAKTGVIVHIYGFLSNNVEISLHSSIIFFNAVPQERLVSQADDYDFVLLPYAQNEFSKYITPAKYFECLALGKPILSRSSLRHLEGWDKFVFDPYNSNKKVDFLYLESILDQYKKFDKSLDAKAIANSNSWSRRMYQLDQMINKIIM